MLHISDASMYNFEAVRGSARGEIFPFDQRGVEPTKCSLPRSGRTGSTAAYNEDIEQFVTEPTQIPADAMCLFHQPIIAKIGFTRAAGHTHCCTGAAAIGNKDPCAMTGATALSTLGATIAPRRFIDAYRTAKVVIGNRMRKVDVPTEPRFDEASTAYFRDQLARARNYLEYGSGGSTVLANQMVTNLVSVDSDAGLLADVRRKLAQNDRRAMAKLIHVNIGMTVGRGFPVFQKPTRRRVRRWEEYAKAPWRYFRTIGQQPDLVLVDGRFRVACVLESLLSLSPLSETKILVNDYLDRPEYTVVEEYADVELVGRMAVLRPRRLADRISVRRLVRQYCADPR